MIQAPLSSPPPRRRIGIVEDLPLARHHLVSLLESLAPWLEVAWAVDNGGDALECLERDPVDALFLDILFPPAGAFPMLEKAREAGLRIPKLIFVTANERHTMKAFDWAACDYLVKPLEPGRVRETLARLRESLEDPEIKTVLRALKAVQERPLSTRFTIHLPDRIVVCRWSEVLYLIQEDDRLFAKTERGRFPLNQTLDDLEVSLSPAFFRVHPSTLVNLDFLLEIQPREGAGGEVLMSDGSLLPVSPSNMPTLQTALESTLGQPSE